MKYYRVLCQRGHVGTKRSSTITFFFEAENALSAMEKGRNMPGVKHGKLPLECKEITAAEYMRNLQRNAYEAAFAK